MIKPLANNILIEPLQEEVEGVFLPETSKEASQRGRIIAVGEYTLRDGKTLPVTLQKGTEVFYKKWAGSEVKFEGKTYVLIEDSSILAII